MTNKALGNAFEKRLQKILHQNGWWCHIFQQNSAGQPCDIIAAKNKVTCLIDAKVVSTEKGFDLHRIEDNQEFSMTMFKNCGNGEGFFFLELPDGEIRVFTLWTLTTLRNYQSHISLEEIYNDGMPIDKWLKKYGR